MKDTLPGSDTILRNVLANGVRVLVQSNPASQSLAVGGLIAGGTLADPAEQPGLGMMLSAILMRGTEMADFQRLHERIESIGASLAFSVGIHAFSFQARMLAEDLPTMLDILLDVLRYPSFPEQHRLVIRDQMISGLAIRAQDTEAMAEVAFDAALFGAHPYGTDRSGTPQSLASITREDLLKQHHALFRPDELILCLAGGIDPAVAADMVKERFAGWTVGDSSAVRSHSFQAVIPPAEAKEVHIEIAEKSQMDLIMGSTGPDRKSPRYLSAAIGNSIFGEFGMMGRVGATVREDQGLAYYVGSSLNPLPLGGSWEISAGVNPENTKKVIDLIRREVKKFTCEPVSDDELSDVRSRFKGRLPLQLESNAGIVDWLLALERFDLGLDYLRDFGKEVDAVTREDVLETAGYYLNPDRLVTATAGTRRSG